LNSTKQSYMLIDPLTMHSSEFVCALECAKSSTIRILSGCFCRGENFLEARLLGRRKWPHLAEGRGKGL
jgi:hypothetical protein